LLRLAFVQQRRDATKRAPMHAGVRADLLLRTRDQFPRGCSEASWKLIHVAYWTVVGVHWCWRSLSSERQRKNANKNVTFVSVLSLASERRRKNANENVTFVSVLSSAFIVVGERRRKNTDDKYLPSAGESRAEGALLAPSTRRRLIYVMLPSASAVKNVARVVEKYGKYLVPYTMTNLPEGLRGGEHVSFSKADAIKLLLKAMGLQEAAKTHQIVWPLSCDTVVVSKNVHFLMAGKTRCG
jgi:hypothetical protein